MRGPTARCCAAFLSRVTAPHAPAGGAGGRGYSGSRVVFDDIAAAHIGCGGGAAGGAGGTSGASGSGEKSKRRLEAESRGAKWLNHGRAAPPLRRAARSRRTSP